MATTTATVDEVEDYENGIGTAGLVVGIVAVIICLVPIIGMVGIPLALIGLGLLIAGMVRAHDGRASNSGSALTGLILSTVGILAALAWIVVMAAAADSGPQAKSSVSAAPAGVKKAAIAAPAEPVADGSAVGLGKAVVIDDFGGQGRASLTVDKFSAKARSNNEFIHPEAGNKFVAAHLKVKNVGSNTYSNVSWVGAKVYTEEGQAYDLNPMVESGIGRPLPSSIDLKPGGSIDGWMLFEIPADGTVKSIVFDDAEWHL